MKNITLKDIILYLLIAVIFYFIFFKGGINQTNNQYIKDSTYTSYDTTVYTNHYSEVNPNIIINKDTLILDTNMMKEIINRYFAELKYIDTLRNDTSALIILKETVTQNSIKNRDLTFRNNRPTQITNIEVVNDYHTGFFLSGNTNIGKDIISFGIGGGYKFNQHSLGLNINTNKSIGINYNYYLK